MRIGMLTSKYRYESHMIPKIRFAKYSWGYTVDFRFLRYFCELRLVVKEYL